MRRYYASCCAVDSHKLITGQKSSGRAWLAYSVLVECWLQDGLQIGRLLPALFRPSASLNLCITQYDDNLSCYPTLLPLPLYQGVGWRGLLHNMPRCQQRLPNTRSPDAALCTHSTNTPRNGTLSSQSRAISTLPWTD